MIEAVKFAAQMFFGAGLLFVFGLLVRSFFEKPSILQDEINAEARDLITEHGTDAVSVAESQLLRSQWAKGKSDSLERAELVLKAVQQSKKFHG